MTWKLITIPISHYCDKARWALDRANIAYSEDGHVPLFHWRVAMAQKNTRTVPIVVHDQGVATDSTDILHLVDARLPPEQRLFPDEPDLDRQVMEWEEKFDRSLGPATRRWAYFHMLPHSDLTAEVLGQGTPRYEVQLMRAMFPIFAAVLRRGLRITPSKSKQSLEKTHAIFAEVSAALSDGRRYLCGDRFTAADLTFAALAAPALLPPDHPHFHVPQSRIPESMQKDVDALRDTTAGQFGLRMYREERAKRV